MISEANRKPQLVALYLPQYHAIPENDAWVNVRELRNVLERAVLLNDAELLRPEHVELFRARPGAEPAGPVPGGENLSLSALERQALVSALEKSGNNQSQAAKILKITPDTLRYRMKKYGLHNH